MQTLLAFFIPIGGVFAAFGALGAGRPLLAALVLVGAAIVWWRVALHR